MFWGEIAFASICYHYDFLNDKMAEGCILCASPMFRDIPVEIRSLAVVKFPLNKTVDG